MTDRFTRISVPLSRDEYTALFRAADREYRHPRDQARAILRAALLGGRAGPPLGPNEIEGSAVVVETAGASPLGIQS